LERLVRRFSRWSRQGVWRRVFAAISDDPDFAYLIVDTTIIRASPTTLRALATTRSTSASSLSAI